MALSGEKAIESTNLFDYDVDVCGLAFSELANTFIARATSNLGNVTFAELNVVGISQVPEPSTSLVLAGLLATCSLSLGANMTTQDHARIDAMICCNAIVHYGLHTFDSDGG